MTAKVKVRLDIIKDLKELDSNTFKAKVGDETIGMVREFISKGISPVRGERKLASYKNPEKYPGDRKNRSPVNLELSSSMLSALTYWFIRGAVRIGFRDEREHDKAKTHQFGLNKVPRRPILPVNNGDEFNISIMQRIRKIYSDKILDIIRKSNR